MSMRVKEVMLCAHIVVFQAFKLLQVLIGEVSGAETR